MKTAAKLSVAVGVVVLLLYAFTGFFVIQPIGAIPNGATVWYVRAGLKMPFIASADGMLLESGGGVSLLGRAMMMGAVQERIADRKILVLPYSQRLYLHSTGGVTFER